MQTGSTVIAASLWDTILDNTMIRCVNPKTQLLDFSTCTRLQNTKDIVDWPMDARDGFVMQVQPARVARVTFSVSSTSAHPSSESAPHTWC